MKVVTWILIAIILFSLVWYGLAQKGGVDMRFIPIGRDTSDVFVGVQAPGFSGGGKWLNSEPLEIGGLRGKVVLVDFWTYSCINCQRTLPYLREWWDKYEDQGLVIVGVHSPEFEFEKETDNVREAMGKYEVAWPVVQDNDFAIWRAYKNHFWPHKYLVDKGGKIVYDHVGEGAYEETERKIQELLGVSGVEVAKEIGGEAVGKGTNLTQELYVNQRGKNSGHIGKGKGKAELLGHWNIGKDYSSAGREARLRLRFRAGELNLVMSSPEQKFAPKTRVIVDGGEEKELTIAADDLYPLWKGEFGEHTLEMDFDEGIRVHAFTFGR
jgi:thiol-disulfide isomerase/thioredoxin